MFTGLITDMGTVRAVAPIGAARDMRLTIATSWRTDEIAHGASIACGGCCLTVIESGADWLAFDASAETLAKTTLGAWRPGTRVNLERALRMGDELGGHLVSGHVDGIGRVVTRAADAGSVRFGFALPSTLGRMIAPKGSIAVDGVSLTVNAVEDHREAGETIFAVNVIPHTQAVTTLGRLEAGMMVNMEVDLLARYVARLQHGA